MGREKRPRPADRAGPGVTAKERHKKAVRHDNNNNDWAAPLPQGLVAVPEKQLPKSKHQSYFEIVENREKKKKLEFQVTNDKAPPPGFEFVPIGNPELTTACKELSREQDAMIFIVSSAKDTDDKKLSIHLHRIGHHIRQTIVEQARATLGQEEFSSNGSNSGEPEPIPETQEEINAQADAALKDLFPRIPNFDRQMIIEHAFKKGAKFGGEPVVGMAADIPLSRRVQLAVLAHIRHNHTRYDKLLKETSYVNARKTVEALCLDILVKWRGDEETGRDQLDEILREVVVISDDSEDDDDTESSDDDSVQEIFPSNADRPGMSNAALPRPSLPRQKRRQKPGNMGGARKRKNAPGTQATSQDAPDSAKNRAAAKKSQRGFKRYQAEAQREAHYQAAWEQAVNRNRQGPAPDASQHASVQLSKSASQGPYPAPAVERVASQRDFHGDVTGRSHLSGNRLHGHVDASQPLEPFYVERNPSGARVLRTTPPVPYTSIPVSSHFREASGPARYRPVIGPPSVPHSSQSQILAPTRRDPDELKDFLVRSIEPVSPSSAPMQPQFIRPMPYREHVPLEQVSSETHGQIARNRSPADTSPRYGEPFQPRRFINDHSAPVRVSSPYKVEPPASLSSHYRDPGPFPPAQPQEAIRVYRVREPIGLRDRPLPTDSTIRIHRGSPRPILGVTEPVGNTMIPSQSRYRELSPHRIIEMRRPVEDLSRAPETRRVVSLESGDVRYRNAVDGRFISQRHGYIQHPEDRASTAHVECQRIEPSSDAVYRPHLPPSMRSGDTQSTSFPVYRETEQPRDYNIGEQRPNQTASLPYGAERFHQGGFIHNPRAYDESNMRSHQISHADIHSPRPGQPQYQAQHPQQHPRTNPREGVIFLG